MGNGLYKKLEKHRNMWEDHINEGVTVGKSSIIEVSLDNGVM